MNNNLPQLPYPLIFPLKYIPNSVHSTLLATTLNKIFAREINAGELDFLEGKILCIQVQDVQITFCLSFSQRRLIAYHSPKQANLQMSGYAYSFMCLITEREDPDSLFFNRRLQLAGDTELGLYVKNFLAALEPGKYTKFAIQQLGYVVDSFEYLWKMRAKMPFISE